MSELELVFPNCPRCNRHLKPSFKIGKLHITEFQFYTLKRIDIHDLLVCRYCKISIKVSFLKRQKNPLKFLKEFKKIPEGFEINKEVKERLRLREEHEYNMTKYKHSPVPEKCPECKSKDLVASGSEQSWECLSCEAYFQWHYYRVDYSGEIEVEAGSEDEASEKAYYYLEKGVADIETDVSRM